ncbi:unnamed protein product [Brassica napus]|uniref:(rape) hypothetical protein n=1 Tax=Brassica napus TaxID=3708 RepID=A0A816LYP8_BRANA|nr:unnamed protein product [Brassica napus]
MVNLRKSREPPPSSSRDLPPASDETPSHSFNVEGHRDSDLNTAEERKVVPPSVRHFPFVRRKFRRTKK